MTYTAHVFPQFGQSLMTKLMSLNGVDSIYAALSNTAGPVTLATSGVSAAAVWSDWTTNVAAEITGTGYTAGGVLLTGVTATTASGVTTLTATSPAWSTATFTANQAIFYDSSASNKLIAFWDFGGAVSVTAGTFTLTISGTGIVTATAS